MVGPPLASNAICWIADFQNRDALDNWLEQTQLDEGYRERVSKAAELGLFIKDSIVDRVIESAPFECPPICDSVDGSGLNFISSE